MSCGGGGVGMLIALVSSLLYALFLPLFLLPPVRWLLTKCVPPGLGPSTAMQAAGRWRCEVAADGDDGNGGSMRVRHPNPNPNPNPNPSPNPNPNPDPKP